MTNLLISFLRLLLKFYAACFILFPLISVYQERRLWKPPKLPRLSLWGMSKVYVFNICWLALSQVGSLILLPFYVIGINVEWPATVLVERWTAFIIVMVFIGPVKVEGLENLPPNDDSKQSKGVVYVANHNSQIDAAVVYYIHRKFQWILKNSIIFLPGVGLLLTMARHVFVIRDKTRNKANVQRMYAECSKTLEAGKSIFIFPQGTRRMDQRLPFKDGAFNIAMQSEAPIVPISIHVPTRAWNDAYPFHVIWKRQKVEPVVLTIHEPIPVTKESNKEALKETCFHTIYNALPVHNIVESALMKKD
jgi:1-acyl-sn-glycerol-3-phosphate acyltransferase